MAENDKSEFPKMMTIDEAAERFGLDPIDEYVGSDRDRPFMVYGSPVVLADSARPAIEARQRKIAESTGLRRFFYKVLG